MVELIFRHNGTKGHMAVYGPGCHPQNIIWTEAKLRSIYYFVGDRQFMDRDVTHKILYGPKRSWGPYIILWVTDRSINCHLARSVMNYLVYFTQYMQICQTTRFCYCISTGKKTSSDKIWKKTLYWSGPVNILKYWPAALKKTNGENKNVKYNIRY
jgi:hypothetical protein